MNMHQCNNMLWHCTNMLLGTKHINIAFGVPASHSPSGSVLLTLPERSANPTHKLTDKAHAGAELRPLYPYTVPPQKVGREMVRRSSAPKWRINIKFKASVGGAASTNATHPEVVTSVATTPAHHMQKYA